MVIFEDKYGVLELMAAKDLEEELGYANCKDIIEERQDKKTSNKRLGNQNKKVPTLYYVIRS